MQAYETIEVEAVATQVRGACLVDGCPCKDARIVSHRRDAFFAANARRTYQTADRVVAPQAGWRIPGDPSTDLASSLIVEAPNRGNEGSEHGDRPMFIHVETER